MSSSNSSVDDHQEVTRDSISVDSQILCGKLIVMRTNSAKRSYRVIFFAELTMNVLLATLMIMNMHKIADIYSNNDK